MKHHPVMLNKPWAARMCAKLRKIYKTKLQVSHAPFLKGARELTTLIIRATGAHTTASWSNCLRGWIFPSKKFALCMSRTITHDYHLSMVSKTRIQHEYKIKRTRRTTVLYWSSGKAVILSDKGACVHTGCPKGPFQWHTLTWVV